MTKQQFIECFEKLSFYYGDFAVPPGAAKDLWPHVSHVLMADMNEAIDQIKGLRNRCPSMDELAAWILDAHAKNNAKREKQNYQQGTARAFENYTHNPKLAKAFSMLAQAWETRKMTRGQYIEKLKELERIFPNAEIGDRIKEMVAHYAKHNLSYDEAPQYGVVSIREERRF